MPSALNRHSHHIDKKLRFRLRIYFLISLIFTGIFFFNIFRGALRLDLGLIALIIGIGLGTLTSRMFHTSWDKDARKVVSRMDLYGIGILALYIIVELFRNQIVSYFTHGVQVGTVGFAVLAGIMFGRVLGTRGRIIDVLKEQKIL